MKKSAINRYVQKAVKIVELALEECCCDVVNFTTSAQPVNGKTCHVFIWYSDAIYIEMVMPVKCNSLDSIMCNVFKGNKGFSATLFNLIDVVQKAKDLK